MTQTFAQRQLFQPASMIAKVLGVFRQRLLAGFSWNVLATLSSQGAVLVATLLLARILGLQDFGIYSICTATVMALAAIAQGGSGLVANKFVAESLLVEPARAQRILQLCRRFSWTTGVLASLLVFGAADWISHTVLARPELAQGLRWVSAATFFQVMAAFQTGALQGFAAFKALSAAGAVGGAAYIALTVGGALVAHTEGALVGFALASLARAALLHRALAHLERTQLTATRLPVDAQQLRLLWSFALPASLAGLITLPCSWLVTAALTRQPDGLALVALFTAANQLRLLVLQLPSVLNTVSFSVLSRLKSVAPGAEVRQVFWANLAMTAGFSTVAVLVMTLAAQPLLRLYGKAFDQGQWPLIVLLLAVLPEMLTMGFYQLVQSAGRMWHSLFLVALPRDGSYLLLALALIPSHGVLGASTAYLGAQCLGLLAVIGLAVRFGPPVVFRRGAAL